MAPSGVIMPLFTWTPGETALFEDVYLATTPELTATNRVSAHQPAAIKMYYHVQPFVPGQKYYWRVDSIEATGTVYTGDVWSFTVASPKGWAPKPENGTLYVAPDVVLQWSPGMNATGHDVYFGHGRRCRAGGDRRHVQRHSARRVLHAGTSIPRRGLLLACG